MDNTKLYIVVPCYNEEETLTSCLDALRGKLSGLIELKKISDNSRIVIVDDGSKDSSWHIISNCSRDDYHIVGIKLSRNKGQQNALLCGLDYASKYADCSISIDADLQDDINAIDQMVDRYLDEYQIVYGVRRSRDSDSFLKQHTAQAYYKILKLLGCDIVYNHADFRLMSREAMESLMQYEERNIFLRGIVPMIGFKSCEVYYDRIERKSGESKYTLNKILSLAIDGITSLSIKPIQIIFRLGLLMLFASLIMIIIAVIKHFTGHTITGWSSVMCSIWGIGGINMFAIGIVGEYVAKNYMESKKRPRYIVEKIISSSQYVSTLNK